MLRFSMILYLILLGECALTQIVKLEVRSGSENVAFASIGSQTTVMAFTDERGRAQLSNPPRRLSISHISYNDFEIFLPEELHDTLIRIELQQKHSNLEAIVIESEKVYEKRDRLFPPPPGNPRHGVGLRGRSKMGVRFPPPACNAILTSVNIRIRENRASDSARMEIRIYGFNDDDKISPQPINTKPIIRKLSELKRNNAVEFDEPIEIPSQGFLLSLYFPDMRGPLTSSDLVMFPAVVAEKGNVFHKSLDIIDWSDTDVRRSPHYIERLQGTLSVAFSYRYKCER